MICLQRTETTVFILKIPKFATSVFQACQQWRRISKKTGDPTDSEQEENDYLLLPGDAIGLLTAMSLAAASLPSSSLECSFETLHECLQSALSVIETKICLTSVSSTTSSLISAAVDTECGAPKELITEPVRTDVVTRIGRRARRQSTIPRGLVTSLKLVTDENSGARALRAVSAGTGSQHVRAQSVVLTLRSWSAGVLKNSYAARCNSRLVATRGNLPSPSSVRKKESGDMDVSLESSTDICIDSPADSGVGTECGVNNGTHPNCLQLDAKIPEINGGEIATVADKDEDEDDVCGSIEYEEARRLLKSLQAVLQGFSSNKTD